MKQLLILLLFATFSGTAQIYVQDRNDPKYVAYQDSISRYNYYTTLRYELNANLYYIPKTEAEFKAAWNKMVKEGKWAPLRITAKVDANPLTLTSRPVSYVWMSRKTFTEPVDNCGCGGDTTYVHNIYVEKVEYPKLPVIYQAKPNKMVVKAKKVLQKPKPIPVIVQHSADSISKKNLHVLWLTVSAFGEYRLDSQKHYKVNRNQRF